MRQETEDVIWDVGGRGAEASGAPGDDHSAGMLDRGGGVASGLQAAGTRDAKAARNKERLPDGKRLRVEEVFTRIGEVPLVLENFRVRKHVREVKYDSWENSDTPSEEAMGP